jgi:hypothetical protein
MVCARLQQVSAGANPAACHQVQHMQLGPLQAAILALLLLLLLALATVDNCRQHR